MKAKHKFVQYIPDKFDKGVIYISMEFGTAVHKCFCGCGEKVVTPLSPTDWEISYNGEAISFYPSIGNWSFKCQSHYWIKYNQVIWSRKWSKKEIEEGRFRDSLNKNFYYQNNLISSKKDAKSFLDKLKKRLFFKKKNTFFKS